MPFVRRLKELSATLRFRLVLWITLTVFAMVVVTNIAVREVEQRVLRYEYDEFLEGSLEKVHEAIGESAVRIQQESDPRMIHKMRERLYAKLRDKVRVYEYRGWFLQLYDENKQLLWSSSNAPGLPPPKFLSDEPFDQEKYRILEKRLTKPTGEQYYVRSGFFQIAIQEDLALLNHIILLTSISILVAAPLGGYLIAVRATRPIAQIIATAAHLQPSNLNERLPIRGTGDELDQLSETINNMLDRLATYISHNREFVANAAHELRSPLAAIRASVEVGLNRSRTPEEYAALLSDVMEELGRLVGLVNRLLLLAEGEAGRFAAKDQVARLDKIVNESIEMFDAVAEAKGVRLLLEESTSALVQGDETYLRQVVRNLVDNAIKYNKSPGEVRVRLRIDQANKLALFSVSDTGVGIDPILLPRIFDRFYRADRARSREKERRGHGLGLSICQVIVHGLHGQILVESEPGQGSTFTVRLPLAADPAALTQSSERLQALPAGS